MERGIKWLLSEVGVMGFSIIDLAEAGALSRFLDKFLGRNSLVRVVLNVSR